MGLLKLGVPLQWSKSLPSLPYIRSAGVRQFLNTYNRVASFENDSLLFGDEIEYGVFKLIEELVDDETGLVLSPDDPKVLLGPTGYTKRRRVELSLRAAEIITSLNHLESINPKRNGLGEGCNWLPEYGAWMVESTPSRPYTGYAEDLLRIERNMTLRRRRLLSVLKPGEVAPTVSTFFLLGATVGGGAGRDADMGVKHAGNSNYVTDDIINGHPRFATLTGNIRARRGKNVCIKVPLYRDLNTPEFESEPAVAADAPANVWPYGHSSTDGLPADEVYVTSKSTAASLLWGDGDDPESGPSKGIVKLSKWRVCVPPSAVNSTDNIKGLYYRSSPGVIVLDADWPRNGTIVNGYPVEERPGWLRLQNGYYLPMESTDGKTPFLSKVRPDLFVLPTTTTTATTTTMSLPSSLAAAVTAAAAAAATAAETAPDIPDYDPDCEGCGPNPPPPPSTGSPRLKLSHSIDLSTIPGFGARGGTPTDSGLATPSSGFASDIDDDLCGSGTSSTKTATTTSQEYRKHPAVHMDHMAFGMGCCCLQVTFQARDVDESRFMYDQLAVLAPIMMALTASSPIFKGRLADTDCRWGVISESVDDRTEKESGLRVEGGDSQQDRSAYAGDGARRIYKSRYDSISTYISQGACDLCPDETSSTAVPAGTAVGSSGTDKSDCAAKQKARGNRVNNKYNDIPVPIDEAHFQSLRQAGIDPALSQHIAHLFTRDPLVAFEGGITEVDDETMTDHFESIQSTNWQTVRWKPPPPRLTPNDPHIGWRTEFRSMEMQLTDFQNAAFTVFVVLATRVMLTFDLNLYIPLSRVDSNMQRAHSRDAVKTMKFFFRRHLAPLEVGDEGFGLSYDAVSGDLSPSPLPASAAGSVRSSPSSSVGARDGDNDDSAPSAARRRAPCAPGGLENNSYEEMTIAEIMDGKGDHFPGLINLIYAYLDVIKCDQFTLSRVSLYLEHIRKRATGEIDTPATWIRKFVTSHPLYKKDSVVSDEICYDLVVACKEIGEGFRHEADLLGDIKIDEVVPEGAWTPQLDSRRLMNVETMKLISRYCQRKHFGQKKAADELGADSE